MALNARPRPEPDRDSRPWWEAVRRHELTVQTCSGCSTPRFPPREICNHCRSRAYTWTPATGRGTVYSWIITHQPFMPALADELPLPTLMVRLDDADDMYMYGNLTEADPAVLRPGLPVEAVFVEAADDLTLIQWRPLPD